MADAKRPRKKKKQEYIKPEIDWTKFVGHEDKVSLVMRKRRNFLLHSFLYYVLDESVIEDTKFDSICKDLCELQRKLPKLCSMLPYHELCKQLDDSGSGSYIKKEEYPLEIVNRAFQVLSTKLESDWITVAGRYGYNKIV